MLFKAMGFIICVSFGQNKVFSCILQDVYQLDIGSVKLEKSKITTRKDHKSSVARKRKTEMTKREENRIISPFSFIKWQCDKP